MTEKDNIKIAKIFIEIGKAIQNDASFLSKLETFIKNNKDTKPQKEIDLKKIEKIDLYGLVKEKTESEIESILNEFSLKELKEISKKHHFGSPSKIKTIEKMIQHLVNQLQKRNIDVFMSKDKK